MLLEGSFPRFHLYNMSILIWINFLRILLIAHLRGSIGFKSGELAGHLAMKEHLFLKNIFVHNSIWIHYHLALISNSNKNMYHITPWWYFSLSRKALSDGLLHLYQIQKLSDPIQNRHSSENTILKRSKSDSTIEWQNINRFLIWSENKWLS